MYLSRRSMLGMGAAWALAFCGARVAGARQDARYELVDLGPFEVEVTLEAGAYAPHPFGAVIDLNDGGTTCGQIGVSATRYSPAIWSKDGTLTRLKSGKLGGLTQAINVHGDAVGFEYLDGARYRPVAWIGGERTVLTIPEELAGNPHGTASDINDAGVIVGAVDNRAVRWTDGAPEVLPSPSGAQAIYGAHVNGNGTILGMSLDGATLLPTIWDGDGARVIEMPPEVTPEMGLYPAALDEDDRALFRAASTLSDAIGVLATRDETRVFDPASADTAVVCSDFNASLVVGLAASNDGNRQFPMLFSLDDPTPQDLNGFVSTDVGMTLTTADAINGAGTIAGLAEKDGVVHGYLLIPRP